MCVTTYAARGLLVFKQQMESYDPLFTPNTTDMPGRRYCYAQQPNALYWNLQQLASALVESSQLSAEAADRAVAQYVSSATRRTLSH